MALIDKKVIDEAIGSITERVDEGTKKADKISKMKLGFEIAKELRDSGGFTDNEFNDFSKNVLRQLGFNI